MSSPGGPGSPTYSTLRDFIALQWKLCNKVNNKWFYKAKKCSLWPHGTWRERLTVWEGEGGCGEEAGWSVAYYLLILLVLPPTGNCPSTSLFSLLKQTKKTLAWENDPYFPTTQQKQTRQFTKSLRSSERGKHLPWPSFPCWLQSTSLIRVCTTVRQPLIFTWMCLHAPHTKIMLSSKVLDLIHHHEDQISPDIAPYNRIVRVYGSTSLPIT